jgi:plasmid maintenance system antidote protein VapI
VRHDAQPSVVRNQTRSTGKRSIWLGRYFGTDPRFWLNLQAAHDLSKAARLHSYKKIVPRKVLTPSPSSAES